MHTRGLHVSRYLSLIFAILTQKCNRMAFFQRCLFVKNDQIFSMGCEKLTKQFMGV